jgi:hypothetical protein
MTIIDVLGDNSTINWTNTNITRTDAVMEVGESRTIYFMVRLDAANDAEICNTATIEADTPPVECNTVNNSSELCLPVLPCSDPQQCSMTIYGTDYIKTLGSSITTGLPLSVINVVPVETEMRCIVK